MPRSNKVYVGMSGGVDSSLSAALLVEQGYDVTGVYMKNWSQDLPGSKCPWREDLADAKRVAVKLGIDFKVFDFQSEYKQKVVDYMIEEFKLGHTPNPDIMCNQEIKFKLFLDTALEDGADMIATGHYARVNLCKQTDSGGVDSRPRSDERLQPKSDKASGLSSDVARSRFEDSITNRLNSCLLKAVDEKKDQTYFLYRVTSEALTKVLFPIGEYDKPTVRKMAAERGLVTAGKKDSQGICFVGQVDIKDFLSLYIDVKPGEIIDLASGKAIGEHEGAYFYTIGQRHGLNLGGGLPYYVASKDMDRNQLFVTTNLNNEALWQDEIHLKELHWINYPPSSHEVEVRLRHQAPLIKADFEQVSDNEARLVFGEPIKAIPSGQSAVIYQGEICLGGGIIK